MFTIVCCKDISGHMSVTFLTLRNKLGAMCLGTLAVYVRGDTVLNRAMLLL